MEKDALDGGLYSIVTLKAPVLPRLQSQIFRSFAKLEQATLSPHLPPVTRRNLAALLHSLQIRALIC